MRRDGDVRRRGLTRAADAHRRPEAAAETGAGAESARSAAARAADDAAEMPRVQPGGRAQGARADRCPLPLLALPPAAAGLRLSEPCSSAEHVCAVRLLQEARDGPRARPVPEAPHRAAPGASCHPLPSSRSSAPSHHSEEAAPGRRSNATTPPPARDARCATPSSRASGGGTSPGPRCAARRAST